MISLHFFILNLEHNNKYQVEYYQKSTGKISIEPKYQKETIQGPS